MDLGLHSQYLDGEPVAMAADFGVLMVGVAARQAVSATAMAQRALDDVFTGPRPHRFAPVDGSFNAAMALAITTWKRE